MRIAKLNPAQHNVENGEADKHNKGEADVAVEDDNLRNQRENLEGHMEETERHGKEEETA
jgi:hypothetical protein